MKKLKVFCDFDGTITVNDVGSVFFNTLMIKSNKEILKEWKNGKISSLECLDFECEYIRASKTKIEKLFEAQEVEPSFIRFYNLLKKNNIDLIILSDGFDVYIKKILAKYNLSDIPFYSNNLIFYDKDRVKASYPHYDPACINFANCKGLQINRLKEDNEDTVYIGDGYSDKCAVDYADIIFAKNEFYDYCRKTKISCFNFKNFDDILKILKEKYSSLFKNNE